MENEENSQDKPSFFDSADESKSWPPSDEYESQDTDEETNDLNSFFDNEQTSTNNDDDDDDFLDDLLSDSEETIAEINESTTNTDDLNELFSYDNNLESNDQEKEKEEDDDEDIFIGNNQEEDDDDDDDIDVINFSDKDNFPTNEEEVELDNSTTEDFSFDNFTSDDDLTNTDNDDLGFDFADDSNSQSFSNNYSEDSYADNFSSNEVEEELKPFRTFTKINLAQELADEDKDSEEQQDLLSGVNRNVLILVGVIVLFLGYFLFNTLFNRTIETKRRSRRPPPSKQKLLSRVEQVLTPVWEITNQKNSNANADYSYAINLPNETGRLNPFAMPQSVINALQKKADLELIAKQKPNSYKRRAYRATLLGVLTSKENVIGLVNVQEAEFEVVEGTSKAKILSMATKSMLKAKENTLEISIGNFVGPWQIQDLVAPDGPFSEAKLTLAYQGNEKTLYISKAEDLGIFDLEGRIDNLEFNSDDSDDQLESFDD